MNKIAAASLVSLSALFAAGAQAAVSADQIKAISAGLSEQQVVAQLGKPEGVPHWANGTHSLVYEVQNDAQVNAYVDINDASGKAVSAVILRKD